MPERELTRAAGLLNQLPTDRLVEQGQQLLALIAELAIEKAVGSVEELAERLIDYRHGGPGLIGAITGGAASTAAKLPLSSTAKTVKTGITGVSESVRQTLSGAKGPRKGGRGTKSMSIVEQIDVDVPVRLAYDQWSQFQEFSHFMKKVSEVEKTSDETSHWEVRVLRSHRDWDATIIEQIPDQRIAWRSDGTKCRVDGAVSFHAVTPNMTRILVVLEYCPWGLLERTGSLWNAQARRVRMEINQFRRHVMTRAVLNPDSVQGWRGEIRNGKVVRTHEEAITAEASERQGLEEGQEPAQVQEPAQAPETRAQDDLDTVEKDDDNDVDDTVEEHDNDYEGDDNADDPAEEYDDYDDDADENYKDEPEREAARSGRR